ncbi:MAG: hypothetical protein H6918_08155 [Sphingomonadaceae bacterium]|nr:hypothetical protein [Sphingomonadaceae bacterium]
MRVALISAMEMEEAGAGVPIAFTRYGAHNLARHQLEQALDFGCEKIVVFCHGMSPDVLALQHVTEDVGARFHAITGSRPLSGLVSSADEILVLADGLLADGISLADLLGDRPGVTVMPAAKAVPAGFERIDGDRAWAGAMLLRGSMVERLADLPPDIDPASALLRIGLQGGTRMVPLPDIKDSSSDWILVREPGQLETASERAMLSRLKPSDWFAPLRAMADRLAGRSYTALVSKGISAAVVAAGAAFLALVSIVASWFAGAGAGFAVLALAAVIMMTAEAMERLDGEGKGVRRAAWLLDGALLATPLLPWQVQAWQAPLFAGIMLLGWLHMAALGPDKRWSAAAGDRAALFIVLAFAGFASVLLPAMQVIAILAAGLTFFVLARARLTPV